MESLLADITMLRALFFEGLRKSRAQQRLQAESPGKVAMVQVCAAQGAFLYTCTCTRAQTRAHKHKTAVPQEYGHTHINTRARAHTHTHTIHTHTHTHTHARTQNEYSVSKLDMEAAAKLADLEDLSDNCIKVLGLSEEYATSHNSSVLAKIVAAVEVCSLAEVQDIAKVMAMLLGQINIAERHHRYRRWCMYKRGEIKMLLFSDGQHHQAQDCFKMLVESGFTAQKIYESLARQNIELVFTAHPTQSVRRSVLM